MDTGPNAPNKLGALIYSYGMPTTNALWIGSLIFGALGVAMVSVVPGSPRYGPVMIGTAMAIVAGALFTLHRKCLRQRYAFYEQGLEFIDGDHVEATHYSDLRAIWALTSTQAVAPVAIRSSSICIETTSGKKIRLSISSLRKGPRGAEEFMRVRQILMSVMLLNVTRAVKAGEIVPWEGGYSIGNGGLVKPDGTLIQWKKLRFSIVQGLCSICGPSGRIGRKRLPVIGRNGVIVMELARRSGAEIEFPRSTFAANNQPTQAA